MKKYVLLGDIGRNLQIQGETPEELIEALRLISFNPGRVRQEFMDMVAQNCYLYNRTIINTDYPEKFIEDLEKNGFIIRIE